VRAIRATLRSRWIRPDGPRQTTTPDELQIQSSQLHLWLRQLRNRDRSKQVSEGTAAGFGLWRERIGNVRG
jgi:hypothetical protein